MRYNLHTQNRIKVARDMKLNVFVGVLKGEKKNLSATFPSLVVT